MMILKNKTGTFQRIAGENIRAYRTIIVPDDINFDPNIWVKEESGPSIKKPPKSKSVEGDLDGDGDFDADDVSIAGKTLAKARNIKKKK